MKNILVPVDGSESSMRAVKKAKEVAGLSGGKITLLYVYDIKTARSFFNAEKTIDLQVQMIEKCETILAKNMELLTDMGQMATSKWIDGNPPEEIINYAKEGKFDLAVIGAHGMSGFNAFFVGSVARKVIASIEIPILVVK